jgi:hypothetical protein
MTRRTSKGDMKTRTLISEAVIVLAFLLAGCTVENANEPIGTSEDEITICTPTTPTIPPPDPCAYHVTRAPDDTLYMGANNTEEHTEIDAPTQTTCPANVVEVHVPWNSSPNPADCGDFGCYSTVEMIAGAGLFSGSGPSPDVPYLRYPTTSSSCESFSLSVKLYTKLAGTSGFKYKKRYRYRGFWENGFCSVKNVCGVCDTGCSTSYFPNDLYAPPPPDSGTDVYRIVTTAKANGDYVATRVVAGYEEQ